MNVTRIKLEILRLFFGTLPSIDELFPKNNLRISNFISVTFIIYSKYRNSYLNVKEAHFIQIDFLQKLSLSKICNAFLYQMPPSRETCKKVET